MNKILASNRLSEENSTREKIVVLLKKSGGMSIDELSKEIGITPMGVRQHILTLENRGLIQYETRKQGIGRPVFFYRLSENADDMFPKSYAKLVLNLLDSLEVVDTRNKVDDLFRRRKEMLLEKRKLSLAGKKTLPSKVKRLAEVLDEEGYLIELGNDKDRLTLKQFNCPVSAVAAKYPEACKYELELFRELLDGKISRTECIAEGDKSCTYNIPV